MKDLYKSPRDRPTRGEEILRVIAVVLAIAAIFSVVASVTSINIGGIFKPSGGKGSSPSTEQEGPKVEPIPVSEYGGVNLISCDFSNHEDFAKAYSTSVGGNSEGLTDGQFTLSSLGLQEEYHVNFRSQSNDVAFDFKATEYITLDYDISLDLKDVVTTSLRFKNGNGGNLVSQDGYTNTLYFAPTDGGYIVYLKQGGGKVIATIPSSCHVTLIYRFDHSDYTNSVALVYIDGTYAGKIEKFAKTDIGGLGTFRIHQTASSNVAIPDYISFDNYSVNAFGNGYDGALTWLFKNTEYKLQDCSDSLLFKGAN